MFRFLVLAAFVAIASAQCGCPCGYGVYDDTSLYNQRNQEYTAGGSDVSNVNKVNMEAIHGSQGAEICINQNTHRDNSVYGRTIARGATMAGSSAGYTDKAVTAEVRNWMQNACGCSAFQNMCLAAGLDFDAVRACCH